MLCGPNAGLIATESSPILALYARIYVLAATATGLGTPVTLTPWVRTVPGLPISPRPRPADMSREDLATILFSGTMRVPFFAFSLATLLRLGLLCMHRTVHGAQSLVITAYRVSVLLNSVLGLANGSRAGLHHVREFGRSMV